MGWFSSAPVAPILAAAPSSHPQAQPDHTVGRGQMWRVPQPWAPRGSGWAIPCCQPFVTQPSELLAAAGGGCPGGVRTGAPPGAGVEMGAHRPLLQERERAWVGGWPVVQPVPHSWGWGMRGRGAAGSPGWSGCKAVGAGLRWGRQQLPAAGTGDGGGHRGLAAAMWCPGTSARALGPSLGCLGLTFRGCRSGCPWGGLEGVGGGGPRPSVWLRWAM